MKIKTSITLSKDLLEKIDQITGHQRGRSALIELAVRNYLRERRQVQREKRDLEILNSQAKRFNEEAKDVLSFQEEL